MKKMNIGLIALAVALVLVSSAVSATTTLHTTWSGSGGVNINFVGDDDAVTSFVTHGKRISGEFEGTNYEDNPYNYGVNTIDSKVSSFVKNGSIEYDFARTDSKTSMYGNAGQESHTLIETNRKGFLAWHSKSNYAQLRNCNYGFRNSDQIMATGKHLIMHTFVIAPDKGAGIIIKARGSSVVNDMSDDSFGNKSFSFGKGCGCYTNAKVSVNGRGQFKLLATAPTQIKTDSGITTDGKLVITSRFNHGFEFDDFALSGK